MGTLKVGAFVDSFRMGVRPGIERIAELGLDGFQVYVTKGEMHPDNFSPEARKEFKRFVADKGLEISALCGDFFQGFTDEEKNREIVPLTKKVIDVAVDLETPIITTHVGVIPEDSNDPVWGVMGRALEDVGAYADARGVCFATETGPEDGWVLRKFIEGLDTRAVRVNLDPANLVRKGFDVLECVRELAPYIVHTHAKDGKREGGEVPLGEGDVPWEAYIAALKEIGFDGYFVIEREHGDDPAADIAQAAEFLRRF